MLWYNYQVADSSSHKGNRNNSNQIQKLKINVDKDIDDTSRWDNIKNLGKIMLLTHRNKGWVEGTRTEVM